MKALTRAALLGSLLIGCGAAPNLDSGPIPRPAALSQATPASLRGHILHEAQLHDNQRANLSSQVIVDHLESHRTHPGDSGGVGYDLLAFHNAEAGLLNFVLDTAQVGQVEILDSQGRSLFPLQPGMNSLELPAGDFLLRLTEQGQQRHSVGRRTASATRDSSPQSTRCLYPGGVRLSDD